MGGLQMIAELTWTGFLAVFNLDPNAKKALDSKAGKDRSNDHKYVKPNNGVPLSGERQTTKPITIQPHNEKISSCFTGIVTSLGGSPTDRSTFDSYPNALVKTKEVHFSGPMQTVLKNEKLVADHFEKIRTSTNQMKIFFKDLPKADLHHHLTGGIYSSQFLASAKKSNLHYDVVTGFFEDKAGMNRIPANELDKPQHSQTLERFEASISMFGTETGSKRGSTNFFRTFDVIESITRFMPLEDQLFYLLENIASENLLYLETKIELKGPSLPEDFKITNKTNRQKLDALNEWLRNYVDMYKNKVEDALKEAKRRMGIVHPNVDFAELPQIRFILEVSRTQDTIDFFADIAAAILLTQENDIFVGVDIDGPEHALKALEQFPYQMAILDFFWKEGFQPNFTLHAGELVLDLAPPYELERHIKDSIEKGHAKRVGHACSIHSEKEMHTLLKKMCREEICVEVCPSSNDTILHLRGDSHPMHTFLDHYVPVAICDDDPGVNRKSMSDELLKAATEWKLTYPQIKACIRNSVRYAFLEGESIYKKLSDLEKDNLSSYEELHQLRPEFTYLHYSEGVPSGYAHKVLKVSPKANLEVALEKAFIDFEAKVCKRCRLNSNL